jgi:hypothetical protein
MTIVSYRIYRNWIFESSGLCFLPKQKIRIDVQFDRHPTLRTVNHTGKKIVFAGSRSRIIFCGPRALMRCCEFFLSFNFFILLKAKRKYLKRCKRCTIFNFCVLKLLASKFFTQNQIPGSSAVHGINMLN